jgi:mannosyltransferase
VPGGAEATGGAGSPRPLTRTDAIVVVAAACLTLALVLPWYVRRPFWFDELVSVDVASLSPGRLAEYVFTVESNMGLYHGLLAAWMTLGDGEGWVRLLSIVFALATLPYVYGLGVRLFDRRVAALAVLLTAANVSFVGHSRDARSYSLALLLVTASTFHLVRARQTGARRDWVLYGLGMGLAAWAHVLTMLVLAAHVVWAWLQRRAIGRRDLAAAAVPLVVLAGPLGAALVLGGQSAQLDWLQRAPLRQLPGLLEWFVESRVTLVVLCVGGLFAVWAAYREARSRETHDRYPLLLAWLAAPPLVAYALSFATPVYLYRYFLVCLPALALLVAAGVARIRPWWLATALAVAAVALSARTTVACQPDCKLRHDEWEPAAALVAARSRPGDGIVVYPAQVRTALDHYLPPTRPELLYPARWGLVGGVVEGSPSLDRALGRTHVRRVWLVTWWLPSETAHRKLRVRARRIGSWEFTGNVHVELYRTTASG